MSTTQIRLTVDNEAARAAGLEGSTFAPIAPRRFGSVSSARARAKNILSDQYDPRLPLDAQVKVRIESLDGKVDETWVIPDAGTGAVTTDLVADVLARRAAIEAQR